MPANNYYTPYFYQQPQQNMMSQPQVQQPTAPQIQNGGFVSVRNETEARNYPIAIGTSVTFKDENAPYIYNKTMGFSQLEAPKFDKYRLVKEEAEPVSEGEDAITSLNKQIDAIWVEIESLKKKKPRKKDGDEDEYTRDA